MHNHFALKDILPFKRKLQYYLLSARKNRETVKSSTVVQDEEFVGMRYIHSPSNSSEGARFVAFESINTVINSATSTVLSYFNYYSCNQSPDIERI